MQQPTEKAKFMVSGKRIKYVASALAAAGLAAAFGLGSLVSASASVSAPARATGHSAGSRWRHAQLPNPYEFLPKVPSFHLTSTTVKNGHPLPTAQLSGIFGIPGGKDISPQLSWSGFPSQTKSFVVSMYDPEAPTGSGFWHWVVADIPAGTTSLPQGAGTVGSTLLPAAAFQLNADAGTPRYIGGAPPAGSGIHDYYITVTALNEASTGLTSATSPALLGFTIDSHTIARATIICPTPAAPAS
jgi:Raf kinase inhibitor-like YbhB/YbcL family protein